MKYTVDLWFRYLSEPSMLVSNRGWARSEQNTEILTRSSPLNHISSCGEISNSLALYDIIGKCHLHEVLCLIFQAYYPAVINYLNSCWAILLLQHLMRIHFDLELYMQLLSQWFPQWPKASGVAMSPASGPYRLSAILLLFWHLSNTQ